MPPDVEDAARRTDSGEVEWPLDRAASAINALADARCVVLGLDMRRYDDGGGTWEIPWSDHSAGRKDLSDPDEARQAALDALERWNDSAPISPMWQGLEVWVLVTWNPEPDWEAPQAAVCSRLGVLKVAAPPPLKFAVAANVRAPLAGPLNGLRHRPTDATSGWCFSRCGEPSKDPAFFQPVHGSHLLTWCPDALPYLCLPPGWRFQVATGHEDIWEDTSLLGEG